MYIKCIYWMAVGNMHGMDKRTLGAASTGERALLLIQHQPLGDLAHSYHSRIRHITVKAVVPSLQQSYPASSLLPQHIFDFVILNLLTQAKIFYHSSTLHCIFKKYTSC